MINLHVPSAQARKRAALKRIAVQTGMVGLPKSGTESKRPLKVEPHRTMGGRHCERN